MEEEKIQLTLSPEQKIQEHYLMVFQSCRV